MSKIQTKNLLIYKDHIFPKIAKPLYSIHQYLQYKNPQLDSIKSLKMASLLDLQQQKRINMQKKSLNQKLNAQLQQYYQRYLQPFKNCPEYYQLLIKYTIKKTQKLYTQIQKRNEAHQLDQDNQVQNNQVEKTNKLYQPLFLKQSNVRKLCQLIRKQEQKNIMDKNEINKNSEYHQTKQQNKSKNSDQTPFFIKHQNLVIQVYHSLYPFEKHTIFKLYKKLYQNFILMHPNSSKSILENIKNNQIYYFKPFIPTSIVDLYQIHAPKYNMKQCQKILRQQKEIRQKVTDQYINLLSKRKKQVEYLTTKFNVPQTQFFQQYRRQYLKVHKYEKNIFKHFY